MISAALLTCLGALAFQYQPIMGEVELVSQDFPAPPYLAAAVRVADVDCDGSSDLLLPNAILLRESEGTGSYVSLSPPEDAALDVWNGKLYALRDGELQIVCWRSDTWSATETFTIEPPIDDPASSRAHVKLDQFLVDLNADGQPELVRLRSEGVHLFAMSEGRYAPSAVYDILPPPRLTQVPNQALWPPEERTLLVPPRQLFAQIAFRPGEIRVVSRGYRPDNDTYFYVDQYSISPGQPWAEALGPQKATPVPGLPSPAFACTLNQDDIVDFAGFRHELSTAHLVPLFISEIWVSLDSGQTLRRERVPAFAGLRATGRPYAALTDINGDGRSDLITEETDLYDSGSREAVQRYLSRAKLAQTFRVYLQDDTGFGRQPFLERTVDISLDTAPVQTTPFFDRFCIKGLATFGGDYNGDRLLDLAVWESTERLVVYLQQNGQILSEPAASISMENVADFLIVDADQNGCSDFIVTYNGGPHDNAVYLAHWE